ncbi:UDP-N-acetylmuramate--L-alanine ligase [Capnocytophaga catalasegens]|uniref:Peptidoglycan synthetase n=1 Tax=Capnocytophaga catalasegens TaxID=1004260 RepID=A0AAV5AVC6_9FLAO|nr:Mur ligase family protein [Capnocytophaga catalasegens]GIZ14721.1 peptidoglycan synthetase [Capnocytophaga catalasegens]GJM50569.1 peptidoglycan synthetase [Capnocytophaga catalasegens]GJM53600.1 peptidoglycan synthetase [Capnocytophaga catalasegens]
MHVHFISIAGAAMHNLALALHQKGIYVTGSDDAIFEPSHSRLSKAGLLPEQLGWFPEKITSDIDAIIIGMHAKKDNPELIQAQKLGIKIYSYPEFIYEQSKHKTRVVIAGSHGKTTITSMILHVMKYHDRRVDYLVGAQLEGFDTMVRLTDDAEFIVLEGDEYLSSPIDLRPKIHWYLPNIALISGIAWDHINVFPSQENYQKQFEIFIKQITQGGILIYNEEDTILKTLVKQTENAIRKIPYSTPEYIVVDGQTYLLTPDGQMPLTIFGQHNMNNLAGAKWVCQNMGIDQEDFYEAIATFKGASKRLEKLKDTPQLIVFKDFAHAPSKVFATLSAVREQFPKRNLIACLELYTYSSLNRNFLQQYKHSLDKANQAVILYNREALSLKGNSDISEDDIRTAFERTDLQIFTNTTDFQKFIYSYPYQNDVLLLMSSGNYGDIDFSLIG